VSAGQSSGRVAVVTGAGSGMGQASALRLARAGYRIAALDIAEDGLVATKAEAEALGAECLALSVDVSDERAVESAITAVNETLGRPYALALAAGVYQQPTPVVDLPTSELDRIFKVNVYGVFHCVRAGMRVMMHGGDGGRIVLWSSTGARVSKEGFAAYCASKGAIESMARSFACEAGEYGITVNVIVPGAIETPMIAGADLSHFRSHLPARHVAGPEDVAALLEYLCSDEAKYVTGSGIVIDGGFLAMHRLMSL
jgi:NAD(P)-dependent dehydrogenase (short-subunit alcohol dehydrogenase family)